MRIETNDQEYKYEPKGDAMEVGMIQFLIDNEVDVPYQFITRNQKNPKLAQLPFNQELKMMTTIR